MHRDLLRIGPQLPSYGLDSDEERGEGGNDPEHTQGDRLRPNGSLCLRLDDRTVVDLELLLVATLPEVKELVARR